MSCASHADKMQAVPSPRVRCGAALVAQRNDILGIRTRLDRCEIGVDVGEFILAQKAAAITRHVLSRMAHLLRKRRVGPQARRERWPGAPLATLARVAMAGGAHPFPIPFF